MTKLEIRNSSLEILVLVARELLPILLLFYPLLLLLDDMEPGIVRSVFNPHWLLLAIVGLGTLSAQDEMHRQHSLLAVATIAVLGAAVGGFWVWWRINVGPLGIVIALFVAVAIGATVLTMHASDS